MHTCIYVCIFIIYTDAFVVGCNCVSIHTCIHVPLQLHVRYDNGNFVWTCNPISGIVGVSPTAIRTM